MIAAPAGIVARFKETIPVKDGAEREVISTLRVIAFDDDGHPLVLDQGKSELIRPSIYGNFLDIAEDDENTKLVGIMPADGWRVEYTVESDGTTWSKPLAGWGLQVNGEVVPLEVDERYVMPIFAGRTPWRLYRPDDKETTE